VADLEGKEFAGLEVLSRLGEGGMGTVYKARQPMLRRFVALKVISPRVAQDPAYIARFEHEAVAAAQLNHPNIVQVYNAGAREGLHYLVEEFVDGETLQHRLDRKGQMNPQEVAAVCVCMAEALDYAWREAQLIHRDIKPGNVLLSNRGAVKIVDLGLAKQVGGEGGASLTQSGMTVGTPYYCSPEQAQGLRDIDFRADIYSLGCTMYHMLSGKKPYEGDPHQTPLSIMIKHVTQPPPAILDVFPECPPPIVPVLDKMLAKKPASRYQSYEELLEDLRKLHAELGQFKEIAPSSASLPTRAMSVEEVRKATSATQPSVEKLMEWTPPAKPPPSPPVPITQAPAPAAPAEQTVPATQQPTQQLPDQPVPAQPPSQERAAIQPTAQELSEWDIPAQRPPEKPFFASLPPVAIYSTIAGAVALALIAALVIWAPWNTPTTSSTTEEQKTEEKKTTAPAQPDEPSSPQKAAVTPATPSATTSTPAPPVVVQASPGKPYTTSIGTELLYVAEGEFQMGSGPEERVWAAANGASANFVKSEGSQPRKVAIRRGFWVGRTEVTIGQWKQFAAATNLPTDGEKKGESYTYDPSTKSWSTVKGACWKNPNFGFPMKDSHPVSCISWNDAMAFCEWLQKRELAEGRLPSGAKIRLPTEAEWEYACRGGKQGTKFWWGDTKEDGDGRLNWKWKPDAVQFVTEVDHFGPQGRNGFGLADMLGNVWEWCQDGFDPSGAHAELFTGDETQRVLRGGSLNVGPGFVRCAFRCGRTATDSDGDIGFRIVCVMDQ
jgi:formylglycine-generating enzyme required for sulfatase activity/serine/threonine protein kinase